MDDIRVGLWGGDWVIYGCRCKKPQFSLEHLKSNKDCRMENLARKHQLNINDQTIVNYLMHSEKQQLTTAKLLMACFLPNS